MYSHARPEKGGCIHIKLSFYRFCNESIPCHPAVCDNWLYPTCTTPRHGTWGTLTVVAIVKIAVPLFVIPANYVDRCELGDVLLYFALSTSVMSLLACLCWLVSLDPTTRASSFLWQCLLLSQTNYILSEEVLTGLFHIAADTVVRDSFWNSLAFTREAEDR